MCRVLRLQKMKGIAYKKLLPDKDVFFFRQGKLSDFLLDGVMLCALIIWREKCIITHDMDLPGKDVSFFGGYTK